MAVYVDDMLRPAQVGPGRPAKWSHLTADTKAELHAFAARLGLRRSWFQDKPNGLWHYDVTMSVRAAAIAAGAEQIGYLNTADFARVYRRPGRDGVRGPVDDLADQPSNRQVGQRDGFVQPAGRPTGRVGLDRWGCWGRP